jgi:predicted RNA-binding protein with PIN domain
MALVRVLVDGYSLLHGWPELAPGQPRFSAAARDELIRRLTLYQDAIATPITIFFDGQTPKRGAPGSAPAVREIEVLYSRAGQTADQMIERAAHRFASYGEVLAVTDDHAERETVISFGGLASSCANFIQEVENTLAELKDEIKSHNRRERHKFRLWLCLVLCPVLVFGQTNIPTATYPGNRYLLVVETSRPMQRRAAAMAQAVQDLLNSALAAQARRADTLGVWTFNEEVYAGTLPLQQWSPNAQKSVSDRVVGFLRAQKFEKRARLDKVFPALERVVRNSPFVTIILVCLGEEEVRGTPFDQRINEFFRTWRLQQQDAGTPFVIAVRAQGGKFVDCTMNPSPWPAELPALPPELFVPIPAPRPLIAEPRKLATSPVPPLIISGKKRELAPATRSAESGDPKSQTAGLATTKVALPLQPDAGTPGPPQSSQAIAPAASAQTGSVTDAFSTPAPSPVTAASGPTSLAAVAPQTPQLAADTPPAVGTSTSTAAGESRIGAPENPKPGAPPAVPPSSPRPALTSAKTPQDTVPSSPPLAGERPTTGARHDDPKDIPLEAATAAAVRGGKSPAILWGVGLACVAIAMAGIWKWRRRSRSVKDVSLITESIDRHKS